jgi:enoyl-CoA hydratase/carnithine racemase
MEPSAFQLESHSGLNIIRLTSLDRTNRLTADLVRSLTARISDLAKFPTPLLITGNDRFFSAGADLTEIAALSGPVAYEFAKMGQALMAEIADFPAPVYAAISGYCMGGGLDLALACHHRIASPDSIFGHRGAALGLITGWGGTQRLPRLIGRGRALQMFVAAEKLNANDAMGLGLVDAIHENPVVAAIAVMSRIRRPNRTE